MDDYNYESDLLLAATSILKGLDDTPDDRPQYDYPTESGQFQQDTSQPDTSWSYDCAQLFNQCELPQNDQNQYSACMYGQSQSDTAEPSSSSPSGSDSSLAWNSVDVNYLLSSGIPVAGFKPRQLIRKRSKKMVPVGEKTQIYWDKRRKNNESARKSREMRKEKEKSFYIRSLELEFENSYLRERIAYLESQLNERTMNDAQK